MNREFWGPVGLAAAREWRERISARSFRVSTVILMVAIAAAVIIPTVIGGSHHVTRVGVVAAGPGTAATVRRAGRILDQSVAPVPVSSLSRGQEDLRHGDLAVVYAPGRAVYIRQRPPSGGEGTDFHLAQAIGELAATPGSATPTQPSGPRGLAVRALEGPPPPFAVRFTGLAATVLIYLLIFVYGQRITSGVVEEKATRVAEVVLASMRPIQLLGGKVIGIGASALAQVAALVATFVIAAALTGSTVLHGAAIHVVLVAAAWMVLGYALHCTLFAAAGSLLTRESEAANVTFPVALPLLVAYAMSFSVIIGARSSPFYDVLAYIPPCAPIASTALYSIGTMSLGEVALSWLVCLIATVACARLAARIYEHSILRSGARVRVRDALRGRA